MFLKLYCQLIVLLFFFSFYLHAQFPMHAPIQGPMHAPMHAPLQGPIHAPLQAASVGGASGGTIGPSAINTATVGGTLDKYNSDTLAYKDQIQVMMFVPFVAHSSGFRQPSSMYGGQFGSYGYPYGWGGYGYSPYYFHPGSNYQSIQTPGGAAFASNYGQPSFGAAANSGAFHY